MGYTSMQQGDVQKPGQNSTDGQLQPMGKTDSWQLCEAKCEKDETCISFDYHGKVASKASTFDDWCYKRVNYQFPVIKEEACVAGWKGGPAPGPPAPTPAGQPTPSPPSGLITEFSCGIRKVAYNYARSATLGAGGQANLDEVFTSLALKDCSNASRFEDGTRETESIFETSDTGTAAVVNFYVSTMGDDGSSGATEGTAWKTLHRAVEELEKTLPATRPCTGNT
jgi:hypothetical protein